MNMKPIRAAYVAAVTFALIACWMGRYELVGAGSGATAGVAYRLDRWTGNVVLATPFETRLLEFKLAKSEPDWGHWTQAPSGSKEAGPWLNFNPAGTRFCRLADGTIVLLYPPGVMLNAEKADPLCTAKSVSSPDLL